MPPSFQHFTCQQRLMAHTKEDTGNVYCSMPKGTSCAEATLNSEKIKPLALAIVELHWSKDIRQIVSQSVENYVK